MAEKPQDGTSNGLMKDPPISNMCCICMTKNPSRILLVTLPPNLEVFFKNHTLWISNVSPKWPRLHWRTWSPLHVLSTILEQVGLEGLQDRFQLLFFYYPHAEHVSLERFFLLGEIRGTNRKWTRWKSKNATCITKKCPQLCWATESCYILLEGGGRNPSFGRTCPPPSLSQD